MFIAHFGVGMAAKKAAPKVSLGLLFIAAQFLDLLWPTLLLTGVERAAIHPELGGNRTLEFTSYPVTHSLLMALVWSVAFGGIYFLLKKSRKEALILAVCVLSHWILDLVVHFHDLPLYPGHSPYMGFGLWGSATATWIIELAIFITGIVLYLRSTTAKNKTARIVFWVLTMLLLLVQLSDKFGPPPASIPVLAWSAQLQWLFVLLAWWADRNTVPAS